MYRQWCYDLAIGVCDEKPKRKNDEIDPAYSWMVFPAGVKVEVLPAHEWHDDDERRKAMALMRETRRLPEERPEPFATTSSKH
jgi:hypothetical protein